MNNILIQKFSYLPDVLIHKIVNYTDIVTYRNGKYIDRINKNDKRYNILKYIPRPIYIGINKILLRLISRNMIGYLIEYEYINKLIKLNIQFFHRELDGFDKYFNIKSNNTYIFDINNNLLIEYYI